MRFPRIPLLACLVLALSPVSWAAPGAFRLTSPDFTQNSLLPSRFTCEGENTSPALGIAGVPAGAKSLLLVVEDTDAPGGVFTHWIVLNIPPGTRDIPAGGVPAGALQGTNDFGKAGYSGPCPPSGTHHYFFRLTALNTTLDLPAGASAREVGGAIRGHVLGSASLMARYAKTGSR